MTSLEGTRSYNGQPVLSLRWSPTNADWGKRYVPVVSGPGQWQRETDSRTLAPLHLAGRQNDLTKRSYINMEAPLAIEWALLNRYGRRTPQLTPGSMATLRGYMEESKVDNEWASQVNPWPRRQLPTPTLTDWATYWRSKVGPLAKTTPIVAPLPLPTLPKRVSSKRSRESTSPPARRTSQRTGGTSRLSPEAKSWSPKPRDKVDAIRGKNSWR